VGEYGPVETGRQRPPQAAPNGGATERSKVVERLPITGKKRPVARIGRIDPALGVLGTEGDLVKPVEVDHQIEALTFRQHPGHGQELLWLLLTTERQALDDHRSRAHPVGVLGLGRFGEQGVKSPTCDA